MSRISEICALLDRCSSFADVGCDHGYCAEYMLKNALCERAYITDISPKSLVKAEKLLSDYISRGLCVSVCCDGLEYFSELPEQVLIAGMGGEEIIKILSYGIPEKFVLQPMKNASLVRSFLSERGCKIIRDDIFRDGRYYFVIKGKRIGGNGEYGQAALDFGRDSLNNPLLAEYLGEEAAKCEGYLADADTPSARNAVGQKLNYYREVQRCIAKNY